VRFFQFVVTCVATGMLAGCAQNITKYDYTALREANPHSILVVPVVNKTTQVEAADTFLATLAPPLAERAPTARLAGLFGADAVLYAEVDHWEASYILVNTTTTVSVHYVLKSGKTGVTLWENTVTTTYSPQASSGNIIADLIADAIIAAMERAHPSYIPLARQANGIAFYDQNKGLLTGPYSANAK
jgi:hypothetical protein